MFNKALGFIFFWFLACSTTPAKAQSLPTPVPAPGVESQCESFTTDQYYDLFSEWLNDLAVQYSLDEETLNVIVFLELTGGADPDTGQTHWALVMWYEYIENYIQNLNAGDLDCDGVPDTDDVCHGGNDNLDTDIDLVPDFCDVCPQDPFNDADSDGFCGNVDTCPLGDDTVDFDVDGTADACDLCPLDPANDADGDGYCESIDNCEVIFNPDQSDTDGDHFGDACDPDIDGDETVNDLDNCPYDFNPDQSDFDGDGSGDDCDGDTDGDDVVDADDQCLDTLLDEAVDDKGCSIAQLAPCENSVGGHTWRNHGAYVKVVTHISKDFLANGLISKGEKDEIVSAAARSACGK